MSTELPPPDVMAKMTRYQQLIVILACSELDRDYVSAVLSTVAAIATSPKLDGLSQTTWGALRKDYSKKS